MEAPITTAQNTIQNIGKQIPEIKPQEIAQNVGNSIQNVTSNVSSIKDTVTKSLNDFSSQNAVGASQEFLNSNSIIAKFVFLILVLIVFLILVTLGIRIIAYFSQPAKDPYIVNGLVPGNANLNISQNPKNSESVTVLRSNNESGGLESTWSVWLLVSDLNSDMTSKIKTIATNFNYSGALPSTYSNIFNKGNTNYIGVTSADITNYISNPSSIQNIAIGKATVNNAPGVYLCNETNTIRIYMDTVNNNNNYVDITNIPLQKWFHLAIRIKNTIMDVYVNGVISGRLVFNETPKQNYEDVHVCANGGFNGQLSNLRYYSRALSVFEINNIIISGPNLTQNKNVSANLGYYTYLSSNWYFNKLQ
jgi:hypothetical protein